MDNLTPIYTEKRQCQDCYKCVRHCPVKAIKIESGYASVMPDLCILCGHCVRACPNGAKKVRDDLAAVKQLLGGNQKVFVSLAPSYASEFPNVRPGQLIQALKKLGFSAVSETALGAQEVSAHAAVLLKANPGRVLFSSACPTVVLHLEKHRPEFYPFVTGLLSPLLTHCKLLRDHFGSDLRVVFIGPCVAKKIEAAQHPELLDAALTFEDLRRWLAMEKLEPTALVETPEDRFVPESASEGAWYPVDGGMIAGMKERCAVNDAEFMAFSGLGAIEKAIQGVEAIKPETSLFLELLACDGGCVNGPCTGRGQGSAAKRYRVLRSKLRPAAGFPRTPACNITEQFAPPHRVPLPVSEVQIRQALRTVGKDSIEDELNCGGCGYDTCRAFAAALVIQKAEQTMCVTHMRKLAQKKANALIQKMPSAVVIVNDSLCILECNAAFQTLFQKHSQGKVAENQPLEGKLLNEVLPFANLFQRVLKSGEDMPDKELRFQNTILQAAIFTIEKHRIVGGILQDITKPAVGKEQVIRKAQEVIHKNLATVQKIACLLGENAAESEITLNSIIESFTPKKAEEPAEDHDWRKLYRR